MTNLVGFVFKGGHKMHFQMFILCSLSVT